MLERFQSLTSVESSEHGPPRQLPIEQLSVAWLDWLVDEGALDGKWRTRKHLHLDFSDDLFKLTTICPSDFNWVAKRPPQGGEDEFGNPLPRPEINHVNVSKLVSLDLAENKLRDDMFEPRYQDTKTLSGVLFTSLKVLKLQHNLLKYPVIVLPFLKELDLSNNQLLRVPPTGGFPDLEIFKLDSNEIKNIDFESIKDLTRLQELDLSENRIVMKPSALSKLFGSLSDNRFPDLKDLSLKENPFCTYFMEYQMLAVKMIKQLEKLDDLSFEDNLALREDMERQATKYFEFSSPMRMSADAGAEELQASEPDKARLIAIDTAVADRKNLATGDKIALAMVEGKKEIRRPKYADLVELLDTALSDPTRAKACIDLVYQEVCQIAEGMGKMQRGDSGKQAKESTDQELSAFVQQSLVLMERLPESRLTLLKSISKFSIVQDGVALAAVAQLATGGGAPMNEIIEVLEENVIGELKKAREQTFATLVIGMSKFDYNSLELAELFAKHEGLVEKFCERLEPILHDGPQTDKEGDLQVALSALLRCAVQHPKNADVATNRKRICYELVTRMAPLQTDSKEITGDDSYSTTLWLHWSAVLCRCILLFPEKGVKDLLVRDKNFQHRLVELAATPINTHLSKGDTTEKLDTNVCKKVGVIIRIITALLANQKVMQELFTPEVDYKGTPLIDIILRAPSDASADPLILAPSLACLREMLETEKNRDKYLKLVIDKMDLCRNNVTPSVLQYIDSKKFKDLYKRCEVHLQAASSSGGKPMPTTTTVPDYTGVTNIYVHEAVSEIVNFLGLFSKLEKDDDPEDLCTRVSNNLNELDRDTLIMQLLEIPSDRVRHAVINCLRFVKTDQLDAKEFDHILEMFDPEAVEREEVLIGEIMSLFQRLVDDTSSAGDTFRAKYAWQVLQKTIECLCKNAARNTYGNDAEEAQKARLSLSAVSLLWSASRHPLLRKNLRGPDITFAFRRAMKDEETYHSHSTEDICLEHTWIGRSIENLLGCLTGQDKLQASSKQGFRMIHRIAEIMEGKSDIFQTSPAVSAEDRAWHEAHMWNDHEMKTRLMYIDDMEYDDRSTQQQCFVSFQALGRLISFLEKHPDAKGKSGASEAAGNREAELLDHEMLHWQHEAVDNVDLSSLNMNEHKRKIRDAHGHAGRHRLEIVRRDRESHAIDEVPEVELDKDEAYKQNVDLMHIRHQLEEEHWKAEDTAPHKHMRLPTTQLGFPQFLLKEEMYIKQQAEDDFHMSIVFPFALLKGLELEATKVNDMTRDFKANGWRDWDTENKEEARRISTLPTELTELAAFTKNYDGVLYVVYFLDLHPQTINVYNLKADELFRRVYMTGGWKNFNAVESDITSFAIPKIPRRMRSQDSSLFKAGTDGYVPLSYLIAATLRAVYCVLTLSAVERVRLDLISRLRFVTYQARLLGLIEQCGSDVHCNVSAKYLRICALALRISPDRTVISADASVEEDHDYIVCMTMAAHYAGKCLNLLTPALSHFGRGYCLTQEQQRLCVEALRLLEALCEVVPYIQMSDVREVQAACVERFLVHLIPLATIRSVVVCLIYDMQVNVGSSHGPYINGKYVKSSRERQGLRELCSEILCAVIHMAPSVRYEVIEMFYKYEVLGKNQVRVSYLSELLSNVELVKCTFAMERVLQDMNNRHERILKNIHVEIPLKRKGGFSIMKSKNEPRMLVITNRRILIMDYPRHGPLTRKCGHCPPESFCPIGPSIAEQHTYAELTRIVRGADSQMFALGWLRSKFGSLSEVFEVFICYRSDVRKALLQTITTLSGPTIETRTDPELDNLVKQALLTRVEKEGGTNIVCINWAMREDYAPYFVLFILTSTHICQADVLFEQWLPPVHDGPPEVYVEEDEGFVQDKSNDNDIGMLAPNLKANKARLKVVQRGFAQEWLSGSEKPRKQLHAFWASMSDEEVAKVQEQRNEARLKFSTDVKEQGAKKDGGDVASKKAKNALQMAMRKARQAIFKDWQQWEVADLERVAFDPGKEPILNLTFGGKRSSPETITIHFRDDVARERWRHGMAQILNRSDNVIQWSRKWDTSLGETTI